ncbi:MAG TPA: hypothetical protein VG476_04195 [Acidimicrobiales bacterium]|nr:hypothetical protein [Acidimicrobiales bacterium]
MRPAAALGCVATVSVAVAACGGGTPSSSSSSNASYCNEARQVQQAGNALASNPDGLANAFDTFDKLANVAPSQIAPSVQTLRSFYGRVLTALGSTRPSQNPQALTNAVNTAAKGQENQLRSAGQQVTDYTKRTCGIDLSGSSGSTTTTKP